MEQLEFNINYRYGNVNLIDICLVEKPNTLIRYATYSVKLDTLTFYSALKNSAITPSLMEQGNLIIDALRKKTRIFRITNEVIDGVEKEKNYKRRTSNMTYLQYLDKFAEKQKKGEIDSRVVPMTKEEFDEETLQKCDWCGEVVEKYTLIITPEKEHICEDCFNNSFICDRCGNVYHEDESVNGLCQLCHEDMGGK